MDGAVELAVVADADDGVGAAVARLRASTPGLSRRFWSEFGLTSAL